MGKCERRIAGTSHSSLDQLNTRSWVCGSDLRHLWNEETMSWSSLGTDLPTPGTPGDVT